MLKAVSQLQILFQWYLYLQPNENVDFIRETVRTNGNQKKDLAKMIRY